MENHVQYQEILKTSMYMKYMYILKVTYMSMYDGFRTDLVELLVLCYQLRRTYILPRWMFRFRQYIVI